MTEPIHWQQLSPNQRDALVAQYVFGRKIWAWRPDRDMLMEREGKPGCYEAIPAYTESMDEAWKVFLRVMEVHYHNQASGKFHVFAEAMEGLIGEIYPGTAFFEIVAKWTPEMIAIAALKAYGLQIA